MIDPFPSLKKRASQQIWQLQYDKKIPVERQETIKLFNTALDEFDFNKITKMIREHNFLIDYKFKNNNTLLGDFSQLDAKHTQKTAEIIDLLLSRLIDINEQNEAGDTPLILAIKSSNFNIANKLIEKDANIYLKNKQQKSAILIAQNQDKNVMMQALNKRQEHHRTQLLKQASECNDLTFFELQLANYGGPNLYADSDNNTLLHLAMRSNGEKKLDIIDILLRKGADIDAINTSGVTALIYAGFNGNKDIIALLIDKKASLSLIDTSNNNVLMSALSKKSRANYDTIANILNAMDITGNNALLNAQNTQGETALMKAVRLGSSYTVELLLDISAVDTTLKNKEGNTALEIARFLAQQLKDKKIADITPTDKNKEFANKQYAANIVQLLQDHEHNTKNSVTQS